MTRGTVSPGWAWKHHRGVVPRDHARALRQQVESAGRLPAVAARMIDRSSRVGTPWRNASSNPVRSKRSLKRRFHAFVCRIARIVFARRAARLRKLAAGAALGDYLRFLAALVEAQHAALGRRIGDAGPHTRISKRARARHAAHPCRDVASEQPHWRETLEFLLRNARRCARISQRASATVSRKHPPGAAGWIEAQATSLLEARNDAIDAPAAPFIMAALAGALGRAWPAPSPPTRSRRSTSRACARSAARCPSRAWYARSRRIRAIAICTAPCARPNGIWCACSALSAAPRARASPTTRSSAMRRDEAERGRRRRGARGDLRAMPRLSQDSLSGKGSRRRARGR